MDDGGFMALPDALLDRLRRVKLLAIDVDGVLTDGKKYYNRDGKVEMKTFCDKDWTAIKRFRALGVNVIFLTGDPFDFSFLGKVLC